MKIKRFLAAAAASVVAVSAMAVAVSAAEATAVTFANNTGTKLLQLGDSSKGDNTRVTVFASDFIPEGVTADQVYGFMFKFSGDYDAEAGLGGSFIFSVESKNWNTKDWSNEASSPIVFDAENMTLARLETEPFFSEDDLKTEWQQIVIDAYWGSGELKIDSIVALDKDGKELKAAAADPGASDPGTSDPGNVDTGVEGVAAVVGVAALAGAALVVAKKRK